MTDWLDHDDEPCPAEQRWPMTPSHLLPRERWLWWEQLWSDAVALGDRYRLRPCSGWWEQAVAGEALAALAAWADRYDTGEWDDPPGKLGLLDDLERVRELIRGSEPFLPDHDRVAFARFLIDSGCQPPPGGDRAAEGAGDPR
jgi:hypothetical protein